MKRYWKLPAILKPRFFEVATRVFSLTPWWLLRGPKILGVINFSPQSRPSKIHTELLTYAYMNHLTTCLSLSLPLYVTPLPFYSVYISRVIIFTWLYCVILKGWNQCNRFCSVCPLLTLFIPTLESCVADNMK